MAGMTFPPYMSPAAVNCGRLRADIIGGYRVKIAFKEWAFICRALATGRQTLVLRKGGIREEGGEFRPDHPAFFLFPTYFHQASETITQEARSKLQEAMAEQPDSGILRLSHFVGISEAIRVNSLRGLFPFVNFTSGQMRPLRSGFTVGARTFCLHSFYASMPFPRRLICR